MAEIIYTCKHKSQHHGEISFDCGFCAKKFKRPSCWPKKQKFCGIWCARRYYSDNYSGKQHKNYKHGLTTNGYRRVQDGDTRQLEHRVVMQKLLSRKLLKNEWVHHINGDKTDNRPENLILVLPETHFSDIVCPKCEYHFLIK